MKNALFLMLLIGSTTAIAAPRIGHHGEMIMKCHAPKFFGEQPAADAQVGSFQTFQFNASENTDIATLNVWVNNQLVNVTKEKQRSGRYLVSGKLEQPLTEGKAWIKVTSESDDGCNGLHVWNVYIK